MPEGISTPPTAKRRNGNAQNSLHAARLVTPPMIRPVFALPLLAVFSAAAAEPAVFKIKTMTAQMKYDTAEMLVEPSQPVKIQFENGDDLPHNLVFCQPGTDTAAMALKQMEKPDEALKRNWLPDDPRIWAHSKMLNPHEKQELTFTAPEKPGTYPYVCTPRRLRGSKTSSSPSTSGIGSSCPISPSSPRIAPARSRTTASA
jgi:plastocyanin